MKKIIYLVVICILLTGCSTNRHTEDLNVIDIVLNDTNITVDGQQIPTDPLSDVYAANDIVYYEEGKDETYGEGAEKDAHSKDEASAHTVVHITKAGTYRLQGTLTYGQIAIDLGEDSQTDEKAMVHLILDNVNLTSTVAPAIIFYNVYESANVSKAGAHVTIADGSTNTIRGSYVAKIYKKDTYKKLHKYDGAFYSKMTMLVDGNDGILNIYSDNEGLDSEMHLTINGGRIHIKANNDGINTNEDGVSITTINGGTITIDSGNGEEGDGIDSNGSIIINGGTLLLMPCNTSADGGLDSDLGIIINGGTILSFGMNGEIAKESKQNYISGNLYSNIVEIQNKEEVLYSYQTERRYSRVLFSSSQIETDEIYMINFGDASINKNSMNIQGDIPKGELHSKNRPDGFEDSSKPKDFDPSTIPENFNTIHKPEVNTDIKESA